MKDKENSALPGWGLCDFSFFRYPFKWIKEKHIYHKRLKFLKKHGYSNQAQWETFNWFIDVMKSILRYYRYNREGTPYWLDEPFDHKNEEQSKRNEEFYNSELDRMLQLLNEMDETNYDDKLTAEASEQKQNATNEFFKMFSKYFYSFWD